MHLKASRIDFFAYPIQSIGHHQKAFSGGL